MKIAILGAGAWGTALALGLAQRHQVLLWGRDAAAMQAIDTQRENRAYLPGMQLPPALQVTASLDAAVGHLDAAASSLLIIATPVAGLRPLCLQLQQCRASGLALPNLVWLCKGFEEGSSLLPHQVVQSVLGATVPATTVPGTTVPGTTAPHTTALQTTAPGASSPGSPSPTQPIAVGVLSGPSFAQEVARGLPCALTIASDDAALRQLVVTAFHSGMLRIYASDDVTGVEVGGAVKNIMAIATGVIDGMGFGANARAALITRGLAEITRLGVALGGRAETFMGLAGIGDLLLTCTGDLSRNRQVGLGLAQGKPLARIVDELGHVAEGVRCARAVCALAAARGVDMPITAAVVDVLFNGDSAEAMVTRLLSRDPRMEAV